MCNHIYTPSHELTWHLTGVPFKRKVVFQNPTNVRFRVPLWEVYGSPAQTWWTCGLLFNCNVDPVLIRLGPKGAKGAQISSAFPLQFPPAPPPCRLAQNPVRRALKFSGFVGVQLHGSIFVKITKKCPEKRDLLLAAAQACQPSPPSLRPKLV